MDIKITPARLSGTVQAIASKSLAHRYLICAALAERETTIECAETSADIEATVHCLSALGAQIARAEGCFYIKPIREFPTKATLCCGESGTTLRLLLPLVGAAGITAEFHMAGRLPERPIAPLCSEMERMGCCLTHTQSNVIRCTGKLKPGNYQIDGSISSQFISGLLIAMSIMDGQSQLSIAGIPVSTPYVRMTQKVLKEFGGETKGFSVKGRYPLQSIGHITVEGDWSNSAFFLGAEALGEDVSVTGLQAQSIQGDRVVMELFEQLQHYTTIDLTDNPDLLPILAVVAACKQGATFSGIAHLRYKESDRIASVMQLLDALGVSSDVAGNTFTVFPGPFHGGIVDCFSDHRIAMSAAIAATRADSPVTILGADCVVKSYPSFWEEYRKLGGLYEQYIR